MGGQHAIISAMHFQLRHHTFLYTCPLNVANDATTGHAFPTVSDDMSCVCMVQLALQAQLSCKYRALKSACIRNQQYLLLHDGGGAGDAVAV